MTSDYEENPPHGNGTGSFDKASEMHDSENRQNGREGNGHCPSVEELFSAEIQRKLEYAPDEIISDGEIHRFGQFREEGKQPGWYALHAENPAPFGSFGDWRLGETFHWRGQQTRPLTPEERAERDKRRAERNSEHAKEQREAARTANTIIKRSYQSFSGNFDDFAYLVKKNVGAHGIYRCEEFKIAIPIYEAGENLVSLQYIRVDGSKFFLSNGKIKGCWFPLTWESQGDQIVICEGYATGATIYETTKLPVIVALNAGNLEPVAKKIAKKYPDVPIIIAGDDDLKTKNHSGKNTGVVEAKKAASAVNGLAVFPPFDRDKEGIEPSHWNDLAALRGKENLATIFLEAVERAKQCPQSDRGDDVPPPGAGDIPPDEGPPDGDGGDVPPHEPPSSRRKNHQYVPEHAEDNLAQKVVARYGHSIRYVEKWGRWFIWDGQMLARRRYWSRDRRICAGNLLGDGRRGWATKS